MQKVHVLGIEALASRGYWEGPGLSRELSVCVPYTGADLTRAALRAVVAFARNLGAHVSLVAVQVVPFPLPLDRPAVSPSFFEQELKALADKVEVPVDAHVVIARDREAGFRSSHCARIFGSLGYEEALVAHPASETCAFAGSRWA